MPGLFVPFAETTGAIKAVTRAVLDLVLDQVVALARARASTLPVAVNVSAYDVNDPLLRRPVAELLASRGLPGSCLVVELTETALLADPDAASVVLWRLAEQGIRIAIDDFGSGYASLLYLRRFPVSVLKLDRSLVQGLTNDPTDAALVRWTIEMAHTLGSPAWPRVSRTAQPSRRCRCSVATRRRATTCRCRCRSTTSCSTGRPSGRRSGPSCPLAPPRASPR